MSIVGDHDHRPFESLQCQAQGVAHLEVQVVGRLIQQQQIGPLQDQHRQYQTSLFPSGKRGYLSVGLLSGKAEAAQEISELLLPGTGSQSGQMVEGALFGPELVELMLGEITDP